MFSSNQNVDKQMILEKFKEVEGRLNRAKIIYEVDLVRPETVEVSIYEVIRSIEALTKMVREIDPERFGVQRVSAIRTPELDVHRLNVCPYCGEQGCTSDHK